MCDIRTSRSAVDTSPEGTRLAFLVCDNRAGSASNSRKEFSERGRFITWVGSVLHINTVGPVGRSITIEPMRSCPRAIPLDGPEGILTALSPAHRAALEQALSGSAGYCGKETWQALREALQPSHPELTPYIDWLLAQQNPVVFRPDDAADRAWQEQKDAADSLTRVTGFPRSASSAWDRPVNRDDTYLAGLIPEPVETRTCGRSGGGRRRVRAPLPCQRQDARRQLSAVHLCRPCAGSPFRA